jgi:hypothetical protein
MMDAGMTGSACLAAFPESGSKENCAAKTLVVADSSRIPTEMAARAARIIRTNVSKLDIMILHESIIMWTIYNIGSSTIW